VKVNIVNNQRDENQESRIAKYSINHKK